MVSVSLSQPLSLVARARPPLCPAAARDCCSCRLVLGTGAGLRVRAAVGVRVEERGGAAGVAGEAVVHQADAHQRLVSSRALAVLRVGGVELDGLGGLARPPARAAAAALLAEALHLGGRSLPGPVLAVVRLLPRLRRQQRPLVAGSCRRRPGRQLQLTLDLVFELQQGL